MTTDQTGKTLIYDIWNRLVKVKSGTTVLESYSYDALGRRITETPNGSPTKSLYFSSAWQVLEEDWSGATQIQYVWSPAYVDAMIERDRNADSNTSTGPGGLEERFYVQQDANWNVTAIVNPSGAVQERYVYDPYGQPTILDATPNWNTRSASSFAWVYLHQGGRYDTGTGLYSFRNRDYSPTLGRWMQLDPLGFTAGDSNLYGYILGSPMNASDPSGEIELVGKRLRTTGALAALDGDVAGGKTPYKDVANAIIRALNKKRADSTPKLQLGSPTKLGPIRAESAEGKIGDDVIQKGTTIWESYLFFYEWEIKCMNLDEGLKLKTVVGETLNDSREKEQQRPEPSSRSVDSSVAGENAIFKLKNGNYRVIRADVPGAKAQVLPLLGNQPTDFTYTIDAVAKLDGVANSDISMAFSFVSKGGKVTTTVK
jgi:RHS repeat-associated protein